MKFRLTSHDGESTVSAADRVPAGHDAAGHRAVRHRRKTARRLRALPDLAGIDLVAVTGYGRDEDRRRAADAGFDRHVVKPIRPDALLRLLERGS